MNLDDSEKLSLLFFPIFVLFFLFVVWTSPGVDPVIAKKINEIEKRCTDCVIVDVKFFGSRGGYKAGGGSSWAKAINNNDEIVDVYLKGYLFKEALKLKGKRCSLEVDRNISVRGDDPNISGNYFFRIKEVLE
jgi:hypothetical protein